MFTRETYEFLGVKFANDEFQSNVTIEATADLLQVELMGTRSANTDGISERTGELVHYSIIKWILL